MTSFLNFFPKKKKPSKKDDVDSSMKQKTKESDIECCVVHLDSTIFTFYLEQKAHGKILEDYTYHQIPVTDDKNYFGLQYTDKTSNNHWLDMDKQIRKQCEIGPPYTLRFRIKFFSSDPCNQMRDEYTRYLYVLQLKQMIQDGQLLCEDLDLSAELAALVLQGELGDYDDYEHTPLFISQYNFLPENQQTELFELTVLEKYKCLKNRNIVPSITDRKYLEKCRSLSDYGVQCHKIKDRFEKDYDLGLTPTGILIYENKKKRGLFPWNQVKRLSFKKNRFKLIVQDLQDDNQRELEHTFLFQSIDVSACKELWKCCVENHAFYRLEGSHIPPTKIQTLFRLKSRFYASSHTEYQMAVKNTFGSSTRRASTFQRKPSQRKAPRGSFERNEIDRKKIQQRNRENVRENIKAAARRNVTSQLEYSNVESKSSLMYKYMSAPPIEIDPSENIYQNKTQRNESTNTNTLSFRSSSTMDSNSSDERPKLNYTRSVTNESINLKSPNTSNYVSFQSQLIIPSRGVSNGRNQDDIILL